MYDGGGGQVTKEESPSSLNSSQFKLDSESELEVQIELPSRTASTSKSITGTSASAVDQPVAPEPSSLTAEHETYW